MREHSPNYSWPENLITGNQFKLNLKDNIILNFKNAVIGSEKWENASSKWAIETWETFKDVF